MKLEEKQFAVTIGNAAPATFVEAAGIAYALIDA